MFTSAGWLDPNTADRVFDLVGDVNGDGTVDNSDEAVIDSNYGMNDPAYSDGDINQDGEVDGTDFLLWQTKNGNELELNDIQV